MTRRLKTLKPRVALLNTGRAKSLTTRDRRTTGRRLQRRRLRVWADDPCCKMCGVFCALEDWELDHIIPLHQGGSDSQDNTQGLCKPCHASKSADEAGGRGFLY